ncbi:MAG TPA: YceD family protein [Steroidobacteraceae bacterium]
MADEGAALTRVYPLRELPRLKDVLADSDGALKASFTFAKLANGDAGARVSIEAAPHLVCQRCMQPFAVPISTMSAVEFAQSQDAEPVDPEREIYLTEGGIVSLRELAEEELLLALPIVAAHDSDGACKAAPEEQNDRTRPFAGLKDLLKKT